MPNDSEQIPSALEKEKAVPSRSIYTKVLQFVKDWGGVATVLIAILYTFPFAAADRYLNWRDHDTIEARQALSKVSKLYAHEVISLQKIHDFPTRFFLADTYNARIYDTLSRNKNAIEHAANNLQPVELYTLASLYVLSGLPKIGLPYYKLALSKAKKNNVLKVAIYRELGSALFSPGPVQNISKARAAYLKSLKLASRSVYELTSYALFISELGGFETEFGDWKCGQDLIAYSLPLLEKSGQSNVVTFLRNNVEDRPPKPHQPQKGCPYKVPLLPKKLLATANTPMATPPESWPLNKSYVPANTETQK